MTDFTDKDSLDAFNNAIIEEFRANDGVVGGPFEGATLLLLTTTGAKSGQPRLSPLAYLTIDGKTIIVGSKAGADTNPHWVHNLRANPRAHVEVGTPPHEHALDRRLEQAHPGVGRRAAGDDGVVTLADVRLQQQRSFRLAHAPLHLLRGIFLLGAVHGQVLELGRAVG